MPIASHFHWQCERSQDASRLDSSYATKHDGFRDFVLDQLDGLYDVTYRAMFGSYGLYHGGQFFGIVHKSRLYFKVTPETVALYKRKGMKPFRPNAKQTLNSFYEVPALLSK